ncbi:MAG: nuclear transport factor 2 family protein [Janthinobacterium lividum]
MSDLTGSNTETVRRFMAALNVCDIAAINELLHPDANWWVLGIGSMDRETLIRQLQAMLGSATIAETKIIGTTAEGKRVAVESEGHFEFTDGRVYRNSYHHLFILDDGMVTGVREYLDTALVSRVFGETSVARSTMS